MFFGFIFFKRGAVIIARFIKNIVIIVVEGEKLIKLNEITSIMLQFLVGYQKSDKYVEE